MSIRKSIGTAILLTLIAFTAVSAGQDYYPCRDDVLEIMFSPESKVRLQGASPVDLAGNATAGVSGVLSQAAPYYWSRFTSLDEENIDLLKLAGERRTGKKLYDMNNYYRVRIIPGHDIWEICRQLEELPGVMSARPVPKPMALPVNPPSYVSDTQNYLRPSYYAASGIDADYAWTRPGGDGSGVTVCDAEYYWNFNHQDLPAITSYTIFFYDPIGDSNHGTAVLGALFSLDNGWGTKGICYGATPRFVGTYYRELTGTDTTWNVPGAMFTAISYMNPGDVLVLEQQWDYNGSGGFVPIEWWGNLSPSAQTYNGVYSAIEYAISNGIIVVEAAGNGYMNLDGLSWQGNSGAIVVGAGGAYSGGTPPAYYPEGNLQRISFSNYGSRVDLQGWGENVVTCGYNDLYSAEGQNLWYTDRFSGTSAATPVVAGAVACCVGQWKTSVSSHVDIPPSYVRDLLISTGTPQVTPPSGNIGPRPNLKNAMIKMREFVDAMGTGFTYPRMAFYGAWGDYDNDGDEDVYISCGSIDHNYLYRKDAGLVFVDVTPSVLENNQCYSGEGAWADFDNDGDLDFYLQNGTGCMNKLVRNDGGGAFTDVTNGDPLAAYNSGSFAWGDYDKDGNLDLYIGRLGLNNRLAHNEGNGTFADSTPAVLAEINRYYVSFIDIDNDNDLDVFATDYANGGKLFRNNGTGAFTEITPSALNIAASAGYWADYDNDGDLDVYILTTEWVANRMFTNDGAGNFTEVTSGVWADAGRTLSASWCDYNNDGYLDLYVCKNNEPNRMFRNLGTGSFIEDTHGLLREPDATYSASWTDYDNDGEMDIFLANNYAVNRFFQNNCTGGNHWLHVRLQGSASNGSGIGAKVRTVYSGGSQIRYIMGNPGQNELIARFGFGSVASIDSLIITWPSGTIQSVPMGKSVIDTLLTVVEPITILCGDANGDAGQNVGDAVFIINYVFKSGPAPNPLCRGDANGDTSCNIGDGVYMINFVFKSGPAPVSNCCP